MSGVLKRAVKGPSTLKRACGGAGGVGTMSTLGKALDSGKRKKKEKKEAAEIVPASGFVVLSGSREDQARQACEALTKMTPEVPAGSKPLMESEPALKHSSEKTAIYSEPGEKVHVKAGPHKGKNGTVIAKSRVRNDERWLDDERSENTKNKTTESYTVEFDGNTQVKFDKPDEELEYYNEDTDKAAAEELAAAREKAACCGCDSGPYYSLGDKARCKEGDRQGQVGAVTKIVEHEETSGKLDDDGSTVSKSKKTKTVTVKFDDGETIDIDANKTERKDDDDSPVEVTASDQQDAQEKTSDADDLRQSLEKIARLASRRILNGDVALDKLIDALTPKQAKCDTPGEKKRSKGKGRGLARGKGEGPVGVPVEEKKADSDTVPAKIQVSETQEGVGEWPKGDAAGDSQEALRVEPVPSNIEKMDEAIDEVQTGE